MVLVFGIAVHQKLEYFRIKYTTSLSNPTFVHSSNTASGKPRQLDLNDSEKMTKSRLPKRTGDKIKKIHSGNSLKTVPQKQEVGERSVRPSVKEGKSFNQIY